MSEILNGLKTSSSYGDLIKGVAASFVAVFNDQMQLVKPIASKIFSIENTAPASRVRYKGISGVESLKTVAEGQSMPELKSFLGNEAEFVFVKKGWVLTITSEAIERNEWKNELNAMKQLSTATALASEKAAFAVLNGAFSTATVVDGYDVARMNDGVALLSSAHPLANGSTVSNVLTNSAPLSPASIASLKALIRATKAENGEPMLFDNNFALVVPTTLEDLALRITGSDKIQGSNNNDVNTASGIEVIVSPFLTSETAYYLVNKSSNGLLQLIEKAPSLKQEMDYKTDSLENIVNTRFATGYRDWRGVAGSKGDSSTYTG